ncbi:MAG TPA: nuclear transport factor 2 family protein [Chitinophagaceae bacterium]
MKIFSTASLLLSIVVIFFSCTSEKKESVIEPYTYKPDDQQLHDSIVYLDSVFFAAYNTCAINLDKYAAFYDDSLEFYHDKGGFMNSKQDVVESTKKFVCGKVTRELVKGSIEVYPIKDYGAIEMGLHKFHNNTEKETTPSEPGKFIIIWQHKNNEWKIKRVVSLH